MRSFLRRLILLTTLILAVSALILAVPYCHSLHYVDLNRLEP